MNIRTPLVIGTVLVVALMCIVRLVLLPEAWISSLAALVFYPLVIGLLSLRARQAAAGDVLSTWLERKAEKDPD